MQTIEGMRKLPEPKMRRQTSGAAMPMMALAHGCLPIYSYCYGAKKFSRFQATMKIQFFAEVIVSVILMLAGAFLET